MLRCLDNILIAILRKNKILVDDKYPVNNKICFPKRLLSIMIMLKICFFSPLILAACGANEFYSDCLCEKTCENLLEADACDNQCEEGCFCRPGYVRNGSGLCVVADDCENDNSVFILFKKA